MVYRGTHTTHTDRHFTFIHIFGKKITIISRLQGNLKPLIQKTTKKKHFDSSQLVLPDLKKSLTSFNLH